MHYFCPATTVRQNQHLLIHRAPTLNPGPSLVFLDPAKKGLRCPNLKSKISLLLQYSILVSHKKSLSHQSCSLHQLFVNLLNTAAIVFSIFSVHLLLVNTIHHCWSIFAASHHQCYLSSLLSTHQLCWSKTWMHLKNAKSKLPSLTRTYTFIF